MGNQQMKRWFLAMFCFTAALAPRAQELHVKGPDGRLDVVLSVAEGRPAYEVRYNGKVFLEKSPLGLNTTIGDFSCGLKLMDHRIKMITEDYTLNRSKHSQVHYEASELVATFANTEKQAMDIIFRVSNHDVAFCYALPRQGGRAALAVQQEYTGFRFPLQTTTFLTPQSRAMTGWKRTKPSYEEPYKADMPMDAPSAYGNGYTFPGLFRIGREGWVLVSETGVDSRYCASRLSEYQSGGLYQIAFPMAAENDGNGTVAPAFALPGRTPWRTLTVGETLKPVVETTVPWDVVKPLYETRHRYHWGRGTWSWILWQDQSINYNDQVAYIDLAAAMGYEYVLVDNWWDQNIGRQRMASLVKYAQSRKVDVFLWYSSSGYWNDIEQGPVNRMDNPIVRKREMQWLQSLGVKGIKVDFFGGDKQETMRLYEAILSDADDHGLMVIFHGATLPRGWERMYPNYAGSEAVLASENMVFTQAACDQEAFNACLHPFIRNTVGCMEFGGSFLNKRLNRGNNGGSERRSSDAFQLAVAVLFQNPVQFFALAPNNLTDAAPVSLGFMKEVPSTWDETRYIDGYPGKYVVLARRQGSRWYIAGINARQQAVQLKLDLSLLAGQRVELITDGPQKAPAAHRTTISKNGIFEITLQPGGGFVIR
ncbi:glycoside hydrolase family 97 protein [Niabella sp. CC-SYL272]|uniref:glycoside hydrolase family 97 protein n=1 Tax=Niabella agricola TaxID=2891571 RepID=UPI001F2CF0C2|nr:glycoside hydrolase family 97 protein [Niabella agricola]MCF3107369.1 glycoside hydrolase family 97 protein [Niabella agricola]